MHRHPWRKEMSKRRKESVRGQKAKTVRVEEDNRQGSLQLLPFLIRKIAICQIRFYYILIHIHACVDVMD